MCQISWRKRRFILNLWVRWNKLKVQQSKWDNYQFEAEKVVIANLPAKLTFFCIKIVECSMLKKRSALTSIFSSTLQKYLQIRKRIKWANDQTYSFNLIVKVHQFPTLHIPFLFCSPFWPFWPFLAYPCEKSVIQSKNWNVFK